jgi:hypothetical protein
MEQRNNTGGAGLMDRVRETATSQIGAQKNRATDGLGSVAEAVRHSSQQLRDQQHETIAQYVEQAAGQLERFANTLRNKSVGDLLSETQDLARRRPAIFIGSAFVLGLFGARFIKSSRPDGGSRNRSLAERAYGDAGIGREGGWSSSATSSSSRPGSGISGGPTSPATTPGGV